METKNKVEKHPYDEALKMALKIVKRLRSVIREEKPI